MPAWGQAFRIPTAGRDHARELVGMNCQSLAGSESKDVLSGLHHEYWLEEIAA
jgi:hypothetical protein